MTRSTLPPHRPTDARRMFRRLLRYFRPYAGLLCLIVACGLVVGILQAASAALVKPTIENVFGTGVSAAKEASSNGLARILVRLQRGLGRSWLELVPIGIVLVFFLQGAARFAQEFMMAVIGQRVVRQLRSSLYERFQSLSLDYYGDHSTGVMLSRITNDVNVLENTVPSLNALSRDPLVVACLLGFAFWTWWQMALIVVLTLLLVVVPIRRFGQRVRRYTRHGQERLGNLTALIKENFQGIRVIKAFGMEAYELKRFRAENQRLYEANVRRMMFYLGNSPVMETLVALAIASVIAYGGKQVASGAISGGTVLSFFTALGLSLEPLKRLNQMYSVFQSALAASERIFQVLDTSSTVVDRPGAGELPRITREIAFEGVRFRYKQEGPEVLKGIDLVVEAGQTVAVVGSSGSGKTTLVNLIPRFFDPTGGRITIDGVDLREVTQASVRAQIALVTQDTFLFDDTVRANIAYGQAEADEARIDKAARMAYAHEFIQALPKGYDTPIGELGQKFSGGQRQRLTIARALFRGAPILLLDEATSSLDTESEREVQRALDNLMRGRTTIVIAHRLTTISRADRIVVLSAGRVVEDGRHDELLARHGEYARLYGIQFKD